MYSFFVYFVAQDLPKRKPTNRNVSVFLGLVAVLEPRWICDQLLIDLLMMFEASNLDLLMNVSIETSIFEISVYMDFDIFYSI